MPTTAFECFYLAGAIALALILAYFGIFILQVVIAFLWIWFTAWIETHDPL